MRRTLTLLLFATLAGPHAHAQYTVLVCGAPPHPMPNYNTDVQSTLLATGDFTGVDILDPHSTTPTLAQLQAYHAVLVFSDDTFLDSTALGDALAAYVDAGGGVVRAFFTVGIGNWPGPTSLGGAFNSDAYQVIVPGPSTSFGATHRTLGTVHLPAHPLMAGVNSFDGGAASYATSTSVISPGSYRVADMDNGYFLIVAKENAGSAQDKRRVDLNFYPPSNAVEDVFWDATTDGDVIMANALLWVGGAAPAGINAAERGSGVRLFPVPAHNTVQVALSGAPTTGCTVELLDATGRRVQPPQAMPVVNGAASATLDVEACANGVYLVRVSNARQHWLARLVVER